MEVLDHIKPSKTHKSIERSRKKDDQWPRHDAIVLLWFYGTIFNDLLYTTVKPDVTTVEGWTS